MRTLSAQVQELIERRSVSVVPFIRMTLRDASTFNVSDGAYVQQQDSYEPYLVAPGAYTQSMDHLPTAFGELIREYSFELRNGTLNGVRLSEHLRGRLLFAKVEAGEWVLPDMNRPYDEWERVRGSGAEHEVIFYRGEITSVGPITSDRIGCRCTSLVPKGGLDTGYISSENSNQDGFFAGIGHRHPVVYGQEVPIELVPIDVGAITTLAAPLGVTDLAATLSNGRGFDPNGGSGLHRW